MFTEVGVEVVEGVEEVKRVGWRGIEAGEGKAREQRRTTGSVSGVRKEVIQLIMLNERYIVN